MMSMMVNLKQGGMNYIQWYAFYSSFLIYEFFVLSNRIEKKKINLKYKLKKNLNQKNSILNVHSNQN